MNLVGMCYINQSSIWFEQCCLPALWYWDFIEVYGCISLCIQYQDTRQCIRSGWSQKTWRGMPQCVVKCNCSGNILLHIIMYILGLVSWWHDVTTWWPNHEVQKHDYPHVVVYRWLCDIVLCVYCTYLLQSKHRSSNCIVFICTSPLLNYFLFGCSISVSTFTLMCISPHACCIHMYAHGRAFYGWWVVARVQLCSCILTI